MILSVAELLGHPVQSALFFLTISWQLNVVRINQ